MTNTVDFIGIGIGPFNLSIAALSHQAEGLSSRFFDGRPHFAWHPGMLVPDCHMQTMFLKDLVSAVAPTSPYSFVNYLVKRKKFYRFLTTELRTVSRDEFSDYLRRPDLGGKRVSVVGGGQSGADLFLNALRGEWGDVAEISWVSRRNNFNALDEAAFANEYFTPEYVSGFVGLNERARQKMLDEQKMTSDGITADSLLTIYRELYHRFEVLRQPRNARLLPSRSVTGLESRGQSWQLLLEHHLDNGYDTLESDVVIFATGYRPALPQILSPLMSRIAMRDECNFKVRDDFTLEWNGPKENNIFAVNASMQTHGIAEPQLSLMAWRSARILNRVMGRDLFDLSMPPALIQWRSGT